MDPVFLNDWKDSGIGGLKSDFNITDADLEGVSIILASYLYADYNGSAYVLFERDGKLWLVEGDHCSCYGLSENGYAIDDTETQWQPEETTIESLQGIISAGGDPFVGGIDVVVQYIASKSTKQSEESEA